MFISLLLKKALPFALTFVVGTALGGLTWLFGGSEKRAETAPLVTRTYDFKGSCGSRSRRHRLVAETKSLRILYTPSVSYPSFREGRARVKVTFGADGLVKEVSPLSLSVPGRGESLVRVKAMWEAVETAARGIQFAPELVDGMPVPVTREVELDFCCD